MQLIFSLQYHSIHFQVEREIEVRENFNLVIIFDSEPNSLV